MKLRNKNRKKQNGAPKWMVTYSDMVTLILVFFILLFSMSQIDQTKFEAVTESFQNRMIFDFLPSAVPLDNPSDDLDSEDQEEGSEIEGIEEVQAPEEENENEEPRLEEKLENLLEEIQAYLVENDLDHLVTANRTEYGVSLVLQESVLFDSGEAIILEDGIDLLDEIASLLDEIPNNVRVEGHTDSRPISSFRYPSNWELSGARASTVVRYLIDQHDLDSERFSSVGYAETKPLVENSPENWSRNRRVEIVILESGIEREEMVIEN